MIGEHTKGGLAAAFIYGESDYLTIERIERDGKACAAIRGTEKVIIDAQELYKRDRADALPPDRNILHFGDPEKGSGLRTSELALHEGQQFAAPTLSLIHISEPTRP